MDPGQRRALPDLSGRNQFRPLPNASESNADRARVLGGSGIERRAASRAEFLCPTIPTIRDLDVALRLSVNDERFDGGQHDNAEGRSGHHLTVSAMADHYAGGVNLRSERNFTAMTGAIDPHRKPLVCPLQGFCWCNGTAAIGITSPGGPTPLVGRGRRFPVAEGRGPGLASGPGFPFHSQSEPRQ
jgi:hypothetical protein